MGDHALSHLVVDRQLQELNFLFLNRYRLSEQLHFCAGTEFQMSMQYHLLHIKQPHQLVSHAFFLWTGRITPKDSVPLQHPYVIGAMFQKVQ